MPFVHILEHVLHSVDRAHNLNIDEAGVLEQKLRVVRHNIVISQLETIRLNTMPILTPATTAVSALPICTQHGQRW